MKLNENQEVLRDIGWLISPLGWMGSDGLEPSVIDRYTTDL